MCCTCRQSGGMKDYSLGEKRANKNLRMIFNVQFIVVQTTQIKGVNKLWVQKLAYSRCCPFQKEDLFNRIIIISFNYPYLQNKLLLTAETSICEFSFHLSLLKLKKQNESVCEYFFTNFYQSYPISIFTFIFVIHVARATKGVWIQLKILIALACD